MVQNSAFAWMERVWPDFAAYAADMQEAGASERTTVIIGSAMLDLILRRLLVAFMVNDKELVNELVGEEDNGGEKALGTFSARNRACCALGLISKDEFKAINTIRRFRNAYAHKLRDKIDEQSFDDLAKNVVSLVFPQAVARMVLSKEDRKVQLRSTLVNLTIRLCKRIEAIAEQRRPPFPDEKEYAHL